MKTLEQIIKRLSARKNKLGLALKDIIRQLKNIGALKIVLFGSFCNKHITPSSDLDLLVIMPETKSSKEWLSQIYERIKRPVACDILVYNSGDYLKYKGKTAILREIDKKGRLLYEKRN